MPESTHALLSPSSSKIWLNCTPSAVFQSQFPNETTEYAEEGTEAHAIAEYKLRTALKMEASDPREKDMKYLSEEMEECTDDYVGYILEIIAKLKSEGNTPVVLIEQKLDFSRYVPGGFGYGDCIIIADGRMYVIDLKYGKGVEVDAEWNSQFLIYAIGALELLGSIYDITDVTVVAFQPRKSNISSFDITVKELEDWRDNTLVPKAEAAFRGEGEFHAGEHCRFCRARFVCKARADHNLELCKYDFKPPVELTLDDISEILGRIDDLTSWAGDVEKYALTKLQEGEHIEGWKIVEGKSSRKYIEGSDEKIASAVTALGKDPWEKSLLGITAMEKLIGKKTFNEVLSPFVYKPAGKPTLAKESDRRPAYSSAAKDFADCKSEEISNNARKEN